METYLEGYKGKAFYMQMTNVTVGISLKVSIAKGRRCMSAIQALDLISSLTNVEQRSTEVLQKHMSLLEYMLALNLRTRTK